MSRSGCGRQGSGGPERGGFITGALFFLLVVAAALVLAWILVVPRVITESVGGLTGCDTRITQFHANPFSGRFSAKDVRVANPAGWGDDALLEIPTLAGRLAIGSLTDSTVVVEEISIDIARLVIVVDADGKTNFEAIGPSTAALESSARTKTEYVTAGLPSWGEGPSAVMIQRLDLRIRRVELVDTGVQPAQILADELNYQHTYENVSGYQQLLTPELMSALAQSPALWQVLVINGLLGEAEGGEGGLQQLWNRAKGSVNSFLQGLEQTEKP